MGWRLSDGEMAELDKVGCLCVCALCVCAMLGPPHTRTHNALLAHCCRCPAASRWASARRLRAGDVAAARSGVQPACCRRAGGRGVSRRCRGSSCSSTCSSTRWIISLKQEGFECACVRVPVAPSIPQMLLSMPFLRPKPATPPAQNPPLQRPVRVLDQSGVRRLRLVAHAHHSPRRTPARSHRRASQAPPPTSLMILRYTDAPS
jgi:hypothetical protein